MSGPIKLIDCSFDFLRAFDDPAQVLKSHAEGFGYVRFLGDQVHLSVIEQINYSGEVLLDGTRFCFFKGRFPFRLASVFRFIKREDPDVIMVQGFIFPVQVMLLRLLMKRGCRIIVQHHGEQPGKGLKKILQRAAGRYIDAYLFTARGNAGPWIRSGIIHGYDKCREILEASTCFERKDKGMSRNKCAIAGGLNVLWVGRLTRSKDPFTVLSAFKHYLTVNSEARLYMIYRDADLLNDIRALLEDDHLLRKAVCLVGEVPHAELPFWYSAADFYVSGSRSEGSGFALLEAMACGCIPIVTDIPPFRKITGNGRYGFLYTCGDALKLYAIFRVLESVDRGKLSISIVEHFSAVLSFRSIAEEMAKICRDLLAE